MDAIDISPLVKGGLAVIAFAIATGHYSDLERWSRKQAIEALTWRTSLPYFFGPPKWAQESPRRHHVKHGPPKNTQKKHITD